MVLGLVEKIKIHSAPFDGIPMSHNTLRNNIRANTPYFSSLVCPAITSVSHGLRRNIANLSEWYLHRVRERAITGETFRGDFLDLRY